MWVVHFVKCCFLVFLKNLAAADYAILALKILVFNLRSNIPSWSSIFSVMSGWCDGFLGINQGANHESHGLISLLAHLPQPPGEILSIWHVTSKPFRFRCVLFKDSTKSQWGLNPELCDSTLRHCPH